MTLLKGVRHLVSLNIYFFFQVKFKKMGTLVCPLCCNSTFAHQKSLKQHLLDVVKNVQCPDCNERFETIVHLAYHLDGMCGSAIDDGVKERSMLELSEGMRLRKNIKTRL